MLRYKLITATVLFAAACGGDGGGTSEPECGSNEVLFDGHCANPHTRYEPEERLDFDNTSVFNAEGVMERVRISGVGTQDLPYVPGMPVQLDLPDAPRSGFRLVMPSISMPAYSEYSYCIAWPIPEMVNRHVYTVAIRSTEGLHHGNMFAFPIDPEKPNPYPSCNASADQMDLIGSFVKTLEFPTVLAANSTQLIGDEHIAFPPGHAFKLKPGYEAMVDMHLLNPTDEEIVVEVVYDFYTMPEDRLEHEVNAFIFDYSKFNLPAGQRKSLSTTCDMNGGEVVALAPHMHQWGEAFDVNLHDGSGGMENVFHREGVNMAESDITFFDPKVNLQPWKALEYQCHFYNDLDHDMGVGIGENEMCFLYGFMTPIETTTIGITPGEDSGCISVHVGKLIGYESFQAAADDLADGTIIGLLQALGIDLSKIDLGSLL